MLAKNMVSFNIDCYDKKFIQERVRWLAVNLDVQISNEHIQNYKKSKVTDAIAEFIWNSLDADANNIIVEFKRNQLEAIESIIIKDDGHGISFDELRETFGEFGGSYKKYRLKSPKGRCFHGKLGHGRYKGFALGSKVVWITSYKQPEEEIVYQYEISGQSDNLKKYLVTDKEKNKNKSTGTTVVIQCVKQSCRNVDIISIIEELEIVFAPYLLAYPGIKISVDDHIINPLNSIRDMHDIDIHIPKEKNFEEINAILKIIEWNKGKNKNRYLCNASGIAITEEPSGINSNMFPHTVYIMSDFIEKLWIENKLEVREFYHTYKKLLNKVENIVRDYYRERLANSAQESIAELKNQGIYPYTSEVKNNIEKIERQVFDICAAKVNTYLRGFKSSRKKTKQFTLRLLRESLEQNPTSMKKVLTEILDLPKEQLDDLANILDRTSLPAIINTTKMLTNRLAFINGLEQILYSPGYEKKLLERSQLHKILIEELWIFGEEYTYGCDDISLTNVLNEQLKWLGREELVQEIPKEELKGLSDIPDVCLYRQYTTGRNDEFKNLVIELKRPKVPLNADELSQIERYAYKVIENKYFDKEKTKWVFILVGSKLSDFAKQKCKQSDRPYGLIIKGENYEVWIREWNQIIQEAKGKLKYLKDKLEYSISDNSEGMSYLRTKYPQFMPD